MPYNGEFDATQIAPRQMGGKHPVGNGFPFRITKTEAKAIKTEPGEQPKGGLFAVEFTSPAGSITFNYNLWNASEQARKIAGEQLSALCHATGIFKLNFANDGAALLGAQGKMDVGFQKGEEPSAEKPEGGFVEIKKVYDINGNEPGKAPAQSAQQSYQGGQSNPPVNQPQTQQGAPQVQSGWNGAAQQPQQNQAPQQAPQQGWSGQPQTQQQPPQTTGGWQQGNNGGQTANPPWGSQ